MNARNGGNHQVMGANLLALTFEDGTDLAIVVRRFVVKGQGSERGKK